MMRNSTLEYGCIIDTFYEKKMLKLKAHESGFPLRNKVRRGGDSWPFKIRIVHQRRRVGKRFVGFSGFNRLTAFNAHFAPALLLRQ